MIQKFNVISVPKNAPEANEPMGSKRKFWFTHQELGHCMFKQGREETGEDWAEKFACEISELLNLPHADYELAECGGQEGLISKRFMPPKSDLVHGNEILQTAVEGYPAEKPGSREFWKVPQHTLASILDVHEGYKIELPINWNPLDGITRTIEVFIGYLMLDALIGNTDRHHENWAWIIVKTETKDQVRGYLAPTYDHASCLGRELIDSARRERLTTKDENRSVKTYAAKAISAIYDSPNDKKPLPTFDVFEIAAKRFPNAAKTWLEQLSSVSVVDFENIAKRFPDDRISPDAMKFALEVIRVNQERLLELKKVLS